ncbi:MAG: hypothetical protein ACTSUV_06125 [Candidatus Ranarchaeia archaeon]
MSYEKEIEKKTIELIRSKAYATLPVISSEALKEISKADRESVSTYYLGIIAAELIILNETMFKKSK